MLKPSKPVSTALLQCRHEFFLNISEARITSTKFYDPTLQGGKDATYSGPRALAVQNDFSILE